MSEQLSLAMPAQTCEMRRDAYSDTGRYWFMRCSLCGQQTNEHLVMLPYWNHCQTCGALITVKDVITSLDGIIAEFEGMRDYLCAYEVFGKEPEVSE